MVLKSVSKIWTKRLPSRRHETKYYSKYFPIPKGLKNFSVLSPKKNPFLTVHTVCTLKKCTSSNYLALPTIALTWCYLSIFFYTPIVQVEK